MEVWSIRQTLGFLLVILKQETEVVSKSFQFLHRFGPSLNLVFFVYSRFIKVEWLTWYRNEAMCTMSEFRVYGSTMINTMLVRLYDDRELNDLELNDLEIE